MWTRRNLILLALVLVAAAALALILTKRREPATLAVGVERMLMFQEDQCAGWQVDWDGHRVRVERGAQAEDGWRLVLPAEGRADTASAMANVKNFNTLDIASVVAPTNSNLEPWGLLHPSNRYAVFLREDGKIREITLWEGKALEAGKGFYVRCSENANVLFVEDWVVLALRKRAGDVRLKQLIPFEPEAVTRVVLGPLRFEKAKLRWRADGASDETIVNPKVDELVQQLSQLRAQYAFDPGEYDPAGRAPSLSLALTGKTRPRGKSKPGVEEEPLTVKVDFWLDPASVIARRGASGSFYRLAPEIRSILELPRSAYFRELSGASNASR
jgi:hypothetical protein